MVILIFIRTNIDFYAIRLEDYRKYVSTKRTFFICIKDSCARPPSLEEHKYAAMMKKECDQFIIALPLPSNAHPGSSPLSFLERISLICSAACVPIFLKFRRLLSDYPVFFPLPR